MNAHELALTANSIRQDVIKALVEAKSGHSAGPLGLADVVTALYFEIADIDPKYPWKETRDRIVLSCGHYCPVLYSALAHRGYFPVSELLTLRKLNSRLQGHPHLRCVPGVENTGGPLGQGVSLALGMALALKLKGNPAYVFCLSSDGEQQEGEVWEAYNMAAKYKVDNLTYIVDYNHIQIDGPIEEVMPLEPLVDKYRAFNLNVMETDGNNMAEVVKTLRKAKEHKGTPTMIVAHTTPGKGVSFMEKDYRWHGKPPNVEEAARALQELEAAREKI
ncbi:MAG: hypothetical protein UX20_C0007G0041 [Candidatus Magasanikbacteria bacterium GW2011_GWC2_45_8]|uniref:Transketolase N-terminal domain-containing protein n=1 Tax=Candidatus Magasanikbacteria bacterium GW2011_GWC2_45_8 TaxID=1619050 RepID=A0A0G1Q8J9_9BACT|nr:MAG: hypothetical protein UX20_C0007G0041 [Candidatus Magasanikbacteria bacterium GW2011_GWC2_45_8]HBW73855.1 transketolase [Candidatus Magasanikbacteria bacterium]